MALFKGYDLIVIGSGSAGPTANLNCVEECKRNKKAGRVALVEVGKEHKDRVKEMRLVSNGLADEDYCHKLGNEAGGTAHYLQGHGVK
ncbi:hypothetical protein EJ03DRAFT_378250 [Teratosphaeria nubilosa]|uniref:Uncharacterized protein n=1 Tax=Teratosphaeria nubilosa TaxID=161662 RepID=A0A6G1KXJ7_9PEZI|nr:hypothetical protein EJ03DRAFT_378250 [Teratosphaeria nubilosa]